MMTIRAEFLMCFAPHNRRCTLSRDQKSSSQQKLKGAKCSVSSQDSLIMKCRVSPETVIDWGKSFKSLIHSKEGCKLFHEFCRMEFSEENINFYEACEQLLTLTDEDEIFEKIRRIFELYISTISETEVSLDSVIRDEISTRMLDADKYMYENAKEQIYKLMYRDSYPRFKNSDLYRAALEESANYH